MGGKDTDYTIVDACQALGYRGAGITRRGVPVKPADPLRPSGQHSVKADQGSEVGACCESGGEGYLANGRELSSSDCSRSFSSESLERDVDRILKPTSIRGKL